MNKFYKILCIVLVVLCIVLKLSHIFAVEFSYDNNTFIINTDVPAFPTNYDENSYGYEGTYQKYFLVYDFNIDVFTNEQNNKLILYCLPDNTLLNDFSLYFVPSSCSISRNKNNNNKFVQNIKVYDVLNNPLIFDKYSLDLNETNPVWNLDSESEETIAFTFNGTTNKFTNLCLYNDLGVPIDSSFYADTGETESDIFITDFFTTSGYTYVEPVVIPANNDINTNTIDNISTTTTNMYDLFFVFNKFCIAFFVFMMAYSLYKILKSTFRR